MGKQEAKVTVFFLTFIAASLTVGALTRFISVGFGRGMLTALVAGVVFLVIDVLVIGLED